MLKESGGFFVRPDSGIDIAAGAIRSQEKGESPQQKGEPINAEGSPVSPTFSSQADHTRAKKLVSQCEQSFTYELNTNLSTLASQSKLYPTAAHESRRKNAAFFLGLNSAFLLYKQTPPAAGPSGVCNQPMDLLTRTRFAPTGPIKSKAPCRAWIELSLQARSPASAMPTVVTKRSVAQRSGVTTVTSPLLSSKCQMAETIPYPEVQAFVKRLRRHAYGILNHADYPIGTSSLEGMNNKIKVIKRKAYGFHDMEYFVLKVKQAFAA